MELVEEYFLFEDQEQAILALGNHINLRHYQTAAHDAVDYWVEKVGRKPLVVMATGTGKTPWFATCKFRRVLILAHRDRLCEQSISTFQWVRPELKVGLEKADSSASQYDQVVVASIQTLGSKRANDKGELELTRRLLKWPQNHFDLIIIDEAHHALGKSYLRILHHFRAGEPDGPVLIGVTATPFRGDGQPLSNLFDEHNGQVAFKYTLEDATNDGWLCDLIYKRVKTKIDISHVKPKGDDLDEKQLAKAVNVDPRNSAIISAVDKHAPDRKSILVFAVDIDHAETLCEQFQKRGYSAGVIHYKIPKVEKDKLLRDFQEGSLRVLVNVHILTEGVDIPRTDCLVFCRPTRSLVLLSQMLGRGTRQMCPKCESTHFDVVSKLPFRWHCNKCGNDWGEEESKNCLVLDFVDLCGTLDIKSAMDLFEARTVDLMNTPIREALPVLRDAAQLGVVVEEGDNIEQVAQRVNRLRGLVDKTIYIDTEAEAVDLFHSIRRTATTEFSNFPWQKVGEDKFLLFAMDGQRIGLWRNDTGEWWMGKTGQGKQMLTTRSKCPWGSVDKTVKRYLSEHVPVSTNYSVPGWKFIQTYAKWRSKEPRPTQLQHLKKLGVNTVPKDLNRGRAHDLISLIQYQRGKKK